MCTPIKLIRARDDEPFVAVRQVELPNTLGEYVAHVEDDDGASREFQSGSLVELILDGAENNTVWINGREGFKKVLLPLGGILIARPYNIQGI